MDENPPRSEQLRMPMSSEFGTNKTVKARFWPWLEPFSVRKSLKIKVVPSSLAGGEVSRIGSGFAMALDRGAYHFIRRSYWI